MNKRIPAHLYVQQGSSITSTQYISVFVRRYLKEFPNTNWSLCGLDGLFVMYRSGSMIERRTGSGRVRTARNDDANRSAAQWAPW